LILLKLEFQSGEDKKKVEADVLRCSEMYDKNTYSFCCPSFNWIASIPSVSSKRL